MEIHSVVRITKRKFEKDSPAFRGQDGIVAVLLGKTSIAEDDRRKVDLSLQYTNNSVFVQDFYR